MIFDVRLPRKPIHRFSHKEFRFYFFISDSSAVGDEKSLQGWCVFMPRENIHENANIREYLLKVQKLL